MLGRVGRICLACNPGAGGFLSARTTLRAEEFRIGPLLRSLSHQSRWRLELGCCCSSLAAGGVGRAANPDI